MTNRLNRHAQYWVALALCLLGFTFSASKSSTASPQKTAPNILLIAIDDLDLSLGAYGGPALTPALDSLATSGIRFDAAYTDAVLCNPSRTALVTGLRPTSTGIYSNSDEHRAWRDYMDQPDSLAFNHYGSGIGSIITLFEHFAASGYYVASSGKIFHNNQQQSLEPWDRHFTWPSWNSNGWPANAPLHQIQPYFEVRGSDWGAVEDGVRPDDSGTNFTEFDIPDYRIANNGITLINDAPTDVPFFLSIGFVLPHEPRYVPQRLLDQYPLESIILPEVMANDVDDLPAAALSLISQGGNWYDQTYVFDHPSEWRKMLAAYYAAITYVDEQVGRVLAALEAKGVADNTIVVVWSDHGYHLGQKRHLQKHTLWLESAQIPLIIREPGAITHGATSAPVNTVDLLPTLVELAGLQMPTDFRRDGRSLVPLLRDTDAAWPWPGTTFLANYAAETVSRGALRTSDWGYISYEMDNSDPTTLSEELYHYEDDHLEWYNLLSPLNGDPAPYEGTRTLLQSILLGQTTPDSKPIAHPLAVSVPQFAPTPIELTGYDGNKDPLIFTITELPLHGKLYISPDGQTLGLPIETPGTIVGTHLTPSAFVFYEPESFAPDQFLFSVSDGRNTASAPVTITNHAPSDSMFFPLVRH